MVEIRKKSVLITGAGKRIGRAIALDLASQGWGVAVHYFTSKDDADDVVAEITRQGGRAVAVQANLGVEAETTSLVPAAVEQLGPLTALINNASVFERDEIDSADRESWDRHMETNLRAPFVLSQAFARQLPAEERGCIVNILDQRVWSLTPHFTSYTLSKAGLWTLTQTLAMALAPQNQGQRHRPRPDAEERPPERGAFRRPVGKRAASASDGTRRNLPSHPLHPGCSGVDRTDDRAGWR